MPGTLLNDRYLIGRVLGHGGFGVTYLGWDIHLDLKLAIKEYLPSEFATRMPGQKDVSIFQGEATQLFRKGLNDFEKEARAVAQFEGNPGVASVRDFVHIHDTAYMVMHYTEGLTLKEYLKQQDQKLDYDRAIQIMMPIMDTLRAVHQKGLLHRDISPDNIYITQDGRVKLLDFGAARYALGEYSQNLSIILKEGFAPPEQYKSRSPQGPWTDVYATAATMYQTLTGQKPPQALDRGDEDTLKPPSTLGISIPTNAEHALMKALALPVEERFQTMAAFQEALGNAPTPTSPKPAKVSPPQTPKKNTALIVGAVILACCTLVAGFGWYQAHELTKEERTQRWRAESKVQETQDQLTAANQEIETLNTSRDSLQTSFDELQGQAAEVISFIMKNGWISIDEIKLRNEMSDTILSDFTTTFVKDDIRYIYYHIILRNELYGYKEVNGTLGIKFLKPDGTLYQGTNSPSGFSFVRDIRLTSGEETKVYSSGWGSTTGGSYGTGQYRIEFWWEGMKVGETSFYVHD